MSLWREVTHGLRGLFRRQAADQDVADEVADYIDRTTAALVAGGRSPQDARRMAQLEVGNATVMGEQVRSYGWENLIETAVADLRYAARRLRTDPAYTIVSALTLALGIGATTAIFSAVNPVLFEPLPYPHANRILMVWDRGRDGSRVDVTFGTYREVVVRSRVFEALAVMRQWQPTLTGGPEPERLDAQRVSASYFRVLGVAPALGRDFMLADDVVNGPQVVVLGAGLWRRRFGSDSTIVGRQVMLDGASHTVIGVMPSEFENVPAASAELWAPLQYDPALPLEGREWGHHLRMIGRLRPGDSLEGAARELDLIARTPRPEFARAPWASLPNGFTASSLQEDVTRGVRPALLALLGAVVLLLAIACVNVTNLQLGRGAQRRGEFAMRIALGAGRMRLIRQLLTESLLLAALGGALGIVVTEIGVRALVALSPPGLPRIDAIRLDGAVFAFAAVVTAIIGIVVGVIPALHASRRDPASGLQEGSRRTAGGHRVTRGVLVVAEVSLALVLLVGAGLLLRSLERLFAESTGFDSSRLLTMQVQVAGPRFSDDSATRRFFTEAVREVRGVPGVASAAFTSQLPLTGDVGQFGAAFESTPNDGRLEDERGAYTYAVTPGYVETMRIPLRRGRLLDERDAAGAPVAVLISEALARRALPGQDPIGQRLHVGSTDQPWYTVVGVVGDVKQASLALTDADAVYIAAAQWYLANPSMWLVVRATGDAAALAPAVRRAIWSVDANGPIARVAVMDDVVAASAAERRFALVVFQAFALAALALAATGIFGVLSGSVAERTRELGVRAALGASRGTLLAMVVRHGLALTGLGVLLGVMGAVAAGQALGSLLFGVTPLDAVTYLGTIALLGAVAVVACSVPAWRASRVDPAITLRSD